MGPWRNATDIKVSKERNILVMPIVTIRLLDIAMNTNVSQGQKSPKESESWCTYSFLTGYTDNSQQGGHFNCNERRTREERMTKKQKLKTHLKHQRWQEIQLRHCKKREKYQQRRVFKKNIDIGDGCPHKIKKKHNYFQTSWIKKQQTPQKTQCKTVKVRENCVVFWLLYCRKE